MYGRIRVPQDQPWVLFGLNVLSPCRTFAPVSVSHPVGNVLNVSWYRCAPSATCFMLLAHFVRAAASRTFCTAGRSSPIRMAMIAITTSSSISVNPRRGGRDRVGERPDMDDSDELWRESGRTTAVRGGPYCAG